MGKAKSKAVAVVQVGPDACIPAIDGIHRVVVEQLATQSIDVDVSQVREADLSFVQLILAAVASAKADGRTVKVSPPANDAIRDVLERGGFLGGAEDRRFWLGEAT